MIVYWIEVLVHQVSDRCDQNGPSARRDEGAYLDVIRN